MNTSLLLEVFLSLFVVILTVELAIFHLVSLMELYRNEVVSEKILKLYLKSEDVASHSVAYMGVYWPNMVSSLPSEAVGMCIKRVVYDAERKVVREVCFS